MEIQEAKNLTKKYVQEVLQDFGDRYVINLA